MSQIVKSYSFAPCTLQNHLESLSNIVWVNGLFGLSAGREHQFREDAFFVLRQQLHHGGRQDDGAVGRFRFRLVKDELTTHRIDLLVDTQFPGSKSRSSHRRANSSPRRIPVVSSSRKSSYILSALA